MQQKLILDQQLIAKYDQSGPRYTSYPTAVQFHEEFTAADYAEIALSLIHISEPTRLKTRSRMPSSA